MEERLLILSSPKTSTTGASFLWQWVQGGYNIPLAEANQHIFGYAVGLNMTPRDHQLGVIEKRLPWEITKGFDHSSPIGPISTVKEIGTVTKSHAKLKLNEEVIKDADISHRP